MARCAIEWAPRDSASGAMGRKDIDLRGGGTAEADPPQTLCFNGERVALTLTLDDEEERQGHQQGRRLLIITSTARLAEVFVDGGYAETRVGRSQNGGDGEPDKFFNLDIAVDHQGGPTSPNVVLRLAGIKGPFRWRRIQLVDLDGRAGGGDSTAAVSATAPTQQTQQQAMAALVALAAAGPSEKSDEEQHAVPESLRELYAKLATAPDSAGGEAVKLMAAALARGVMDVGGAGGGAAEAAAPSDGRRQAEPPDTSAGLERVLRAIAASEERVLAAVDALARRVGALEAALGAAAAAGRGDGSNT